MPEARKDGPQEDLPLIARLFVDAGNPLTANGRGFKTGHEPVHTSKSKQCVKLDHEEKRWYCFQCQRGGGLIQAVVSLRGVSYQDARNYLQEQYGWRGSSRAGQGRSQDFEDNEKKEDGSAKSDQSWEPPIPFDDFDLPVFPVDALPEWLRTFVEAVARATQTPPDLVAMLVLSVVAAACAKKVHIPVWDGYSEPVNVFVVVSLSPGNRKSAVFADVTAPLAEWEEEEARRLGPEIAEALTKHKILEGRLQKAQKAATDAKPDDKEQLTREAVELAKELAKMVIPVAPRLIADDTSPERLATLLRDQGGRMTVMSPEGDIFDIMAGRYSATGTSNFGVFLKGHAGDTLRVDRVGRPPEFVKAPALTLGLAVQPAVLGGLMQKQGFRGRGLLGRFFYSLPTSLLGRRKVNPPAVPPAVRETYRQLVRQLLALPFAKDEEGNLVAFGLRPSLEARQELKKFAQWVEPQLAITGALGHMTDWAGKLVGGVARITGILHMAAQASSPQPWDLPIAAETVAWAVRIGKDYLIPHAQAAYEVMGADPVTEDAKYLLRVILKKEWLTFTQRDIHQATRSRFKHADDIAPALALLEERGFIRAKTQEEDKGPGRPSSPVFEVNPFSQKSHNTQKAAGQGNFEDSEDSEDSEDRGAGLGTNGDGAWEEGEV